MLVDLVDLAPDQSKFSKNRKFLLGGVREWWLNWLNLGISPFFCNLTLLAFLKGVAQMLVDLVDLAPDQFKLSENSKFLHGGVCELSLIHI